jgi:ABC-2 type transport system permease protein
MNATLISSPTFTLASPRSARAVARKAEWTKLRTLRSTWLTSVISIATAVALSALASGSDARDWDTMTAEERLAYDPTSTSLIGVLFGALVLGALGVRTISSEYSTGMIRTTAAAVPRRGRILFTKVVVLSVLTFVVALIANVAGFAVGQAILGRKGLDVPITDWNSVAAIAAGALAVSAFAVIGVGLGTIVKRASVANTLMALVVIGGQLVGTAMPASSQRFLPFNALQATVTVQRSDDLLSPAVALGFIVAYAVAAVGVGAALLRRRDV